MQPGRDHPRSSHPSLRSPSPLDALRQPTMVPVLHSTLLASVTRDDGMREELYHERPARGSHPGAVFLISTHSREDTAGNTRRILYAMAPRTNTDAWIREVENRFKAFSREEFFQHFVIECAAQTLIEGGTSHPSPAARR